MVMRMEYFNKIQCYRPSIGIVDAPVSIDEIALLQDSVDKNMLGRIKFINYSKGTIVAIFVRLCAANIAGESISLDKERFIYQDMKISSGELYGNRIPISLPEDTRYFSVQLEKVVFDNGEIWDSANETTCKISQKQIQVPDQIIDRVKKELEKHLNNVEYVRYFYEKGQNFWECSCGRINSSDNEVCPFCNNSNVSQKKHLTQEEVSKIINEKEKELQQEQEKMLHAKRDYEEKMARQEQEEKDRLERLHQEKLREEEVKRKKKKKIIIIVIVGAIIGIIIGATAYSSWYKNEYGISEQEKKQLKAVYKQYEELKNDILHIYLQYDDKVSSYRKILSDEEDEILESDSYKKLRDKMFDKISLLNSLTEQFPQKYQKIYVQLIKTTELYYEIRTDFVDLVYVLNDVYRIQNSKYINSDYLLDVDDEISKLEDYLQDEYLNLKKVKKSKDINYKYSPCTFSYDFE